MVYRVTPKGIHPTNLSATSYTPMRSAQSPLVAIKFLRAVASPLPYGERHSSGYRNIWTKTIQKFKTTVSYCFNFRKESALNIRSFSQTSEQKLQHMSAVYVDGHLCEIMRYSRKRQGVI